VCTETRLLSLPPTLSLSPAVRHVVSSFALAVHYKDKIEEGTSHHNKEEERTSASFYRLSSNKKERRRTQFNNTGKTPIALTRSTNERRGLKGEASTLKKSHLTSAISSHSLY
jgi:hypothetical protein